MTSIALLRGADVYNLTTSYDTWVLVGSIFHVFTSLKNSTELLILCWLLFSVVWIILTSYLEFPEGGVLINDTTVRMVKCDCDRITAN